MIETVDAYGNAEATFKELRTQYDNVTPEFRKETAYEAESTNSILTEKYMEILRESKFMYAKHTN